jgi:MoxR-like ATPase
MEILKRIVSNIEKVIVGKRGAVEMVVCAVLCGGHVLIEDVPGVGKTSLARSLAKSLDCSFRRIQFTPDIMPSDITGFSVFNPKKGDFEYREGAIMAHIVLADEINRTSPKTQASLLEVMEEGSVTVDGATYAVPQPFVVLATQNPIEYLGTYPLPEAQLDRFFIRVSLGYPSNKDEARMLGRFQQTVSPIDSLLPVVTVDKLNELRGLVNDVFIHSEINEYIVALSNATRGNEHVALGASPRASICLSRAAQAWAMYNDRDFVIPDDVIKMADAVFGHRIILKQESKLRKITVGEILDNVLDTVRLPS